MGRAVKDSRLDSREARLRLRLKSNREPYWRLIHEGLHLGYRKGKRGGVWMVRVHNDGRYVKRVIAHVDDTHDSNGCTVLSYREAQERAKAIADEITGPKPNEPYTVADAIQDYLGWYASHKKALNATRYAINAHILPKLGDNLVAELTPRIIREWHEAVARARARARSSVLRGRSNIREGDDRRYDRRARRATANRVLTVLKAALNHAWRDGKAPSDEPWRKVKPFPSVDAPTVRYLSVDECARLINACAPDFRLLVQAALLTGCRYGELPRLVVSDFNADAWTVLVREGKADKPRHVYLTEEGRRFFERATAAKQGNEPIFLRADGKPWGTAHQQRPLARACAAANITRAISFHILRHTYGSQLAMRGVPLQVIAEGLGHADTRITSRHYAHLMPSYVAKTIREKLPRFGVADDNVAVMRQT